MEVEFLLFLPLLVFQLWCSKELMTEKKDRKGSRLGHETATLEMERVLLPFLFILGQLGSEHIVITVDSLACVSGFKNHYMTGDICATILTKGLHLISAHMESVIHVSGRSPPVNIEPKARRFGQSSL